MRCRVLRSMYGAPDHSRTSSRERYNHATAWWRWSWGATACARCQPACAARLAVAFVAPAHGELGHQRLQYADPPGLQLRPARRRRHKAPKHGINRQPPAPVTAAITYEPPRQTSAKHAGSLASSKPREAASAAVSLSSSAACAQQQARLVRLTATGGAWSGGSRAASYVQYRRQRLLQRGQQSGVSLVPQRAQAYTALPRRCQVRPAAIPGPTAAQTHPRHVIQRRPSALQSTAALELVELHQQLLLCSGKLTTAHSASQLR